MLEVTVDFETASMLDLPTVGADVYAAHVTTTILSLAYDVYGTTHLWDHSSDHLRKMAGWEDAIFICHNAGFEKAIWRHIMVPQYGFPDIPNARWHDTMASCALRQVPLKLEKALKVFGLEDKDKAASRFTINLSKPNKKGEFDRSPATMQKVYDYNASDVRIEKALHKRVGFLPAEERKVWLLDQLINERGVGVDLPFVRAAMGIVARATVPLVHEFREITSGLEPTQVKAIGGWLRDQGVDLPDLRKETLAKLGLGDDDADERDEGLFIQRGVDTLPANARRALVIRSLVGSSAVKKLPRMVHCCGPDARARGLLQYHRAGPGRWAGRLFQPQNFPRGLLSKETDRDEVVASIMAGSGEGFSLVDDTPAHPIQVVASALRMALIPDDGKIFAVGDFAGIEARLVLALAGQHDKTALMASGADVYLDMARQIYGREVTKTETEARQTGKNSVLGCGFQMGWKKFRDRYCPDQPEEFAKDVIKAYRGDWAVEVPKLWGALEEAAFETVARCKPHEAYGIRYEIEGEWLTARLLDGKKLYYLHPKIEKRNLPWHTKERPAVKDSVVYSAEKSGQMRRIAAYGGLLTENVVQGHARQLLVHAMFECEAECMPVVLTVHDEIVCEIAHKGLDYAGMLCNIMQDRPQWAKEIQVPVAAECWQGARYRK